MRLHTYKNRPIHMGPLPSETLKRSDDSIDLSSIKTLSQLSFKDEDNAESLVNGMRLYAKYMDAARNGPVSVSKPEIPASLTERAHQAKSMCYFMDALEVGCSELAPEMFLPKPYINPDLTELHTDLGQLPEDRPGFHHHVAHGLQAGIDENNESVDHHSHAITIISDYAREVTPYESGYTWLYGTGSHRGSIRASEIAVVLACYLRAMGFEARAHTQSTTDVDLAKLAVVSGVAEVEFDGSITHPYLGKSFAVAVVTTTMAVQADRPLAARNLMDQFKSHGPSWLLGGGMGLGKGMGTTKNAFNVDPYKKKSFETDVYGMSKIKRQDVPTTFIDELRVPRVPKRHDAFWRGNFGDMGEAVQDASNDEYCVIKSVFAEAQYGLIGALHLIERGEASEHKTPGYDDPELNSKKIKSALHFLGADMVGISKAPDWVWYSHDLDGTEIQSEHDHAITMLIDQGHETMEGASGDDWIASSQSMRAYLRGMLLGGIVAEHIRSLGYQASTHSVVNSDVLQMPLVLLSGLGEVSRIGDTALNPFLGPRLKTLVITTNMRLQVDKPIDFGLQSFCNACNKCARECPSGAISAGPKVMFNGYEIWKADVEKCTRYRTSQNSGAMCGRCMKTCPWNLEGLVVEAPFRWLAMKVPRAAKWLALIDDKLRRGSINPVKKWWWDIETTPQGVKQQVPPERVNTRNLNLDLDLKYEDQSLAAYPADMAPAPIPVIHPMDRNAAIARYQSLLSPEEHKARIAVGDTDNLVPLYTIPDDAPDVQYLRIAKREMMADGVVKFELENKDGSDVTSFTAGAHIDLVIDAPFTRQYSLAGNPADTKKYVLGILNEPEGRGGSQRAHERLYEGLIVPVTGPRNHFPVEEDATKSLLIGGGIGITPLIAMAHRLHQIGREFELHYCLHSRKTAGFIDDLEAQPWRGNVFFHISDQGSRADLSALVGQPDVGKYLYTCGPTQFMASVLSIAELQGWNDENVRKEYFTVPERPAFENSAFDVALKKSGKTIHIPANKTLAEVLLDNDVFVKQKCSDGLCGTCSMEYLEGDIEHRDFVLSKKDRETKIITCCSRAEPNGKTILLDV